MQKRISLQHDRYIATDRDKIAKYGVSMETWLEP